MTDICRKFWVPLPIFIIYRSPNSTLKILNTFVRFKDDFTLAFTRFMIISFYPK